MITPKYSLMLVSIITLIEVSPRVMISLRSVGDSFAKLVAIGVWVVINGMPSVSIEMAIIGISNPAAMFLLRNP